MAQGSMDSDRLSSAGLSTHSSGTAGTVGGSVVGVRVGEAVLKQETEDEYSLGPLPPMWEKAFTPTGEAYFIDHNSGTSHWLDPRLARVRKHSLGECGEDELPYGWERVTDERYGSYYVDHINRRTQYENPVLQARRLRDNIIKDGPNGKVSNGSNPTGELRGERFTVTLTKGTQGLGFTMISADLEGLPETEGYLQIRSIVPRSPAWIDGGLRPGDVLAGVGARGVRGMSHAQVALMFQSIAPGSQVPVHVVRGYPLSFDSDPNTRVLSTLAVDAVPPPADAVAMQQLTQALRTRFNLDSPNDVDPPGRDEPDSSPVTPHSPSQRRLMSRSFDLDELGTTSEPNPIPPRCPSADHLLTLATDRGRSSRMNSEPGRELLLSLRRGAAGFGFTIADSVHGQKVKKVLDRSRCAGLREGDLLLQIGDSDVRHAPHQHVVQVLKECPALLETSLRVWRREASNGRAPRSRSATRPQHTTPINTQMSRSKTPTAEQLRSPSLQTTDIVHTRLNPMDTEATYAVPEHKRDTLIERRRRSSTPGGRLTLPVIEPWTDPNHNQNWPETQETWVDNANINNNIRNWAETANWDDPRLEGYGNWGEVPTPTVHVDMKYWTGNSSVADSSDNGGFPEDGMLHSPTTAAISMAASSRNRTHSPHTSGRLRNHSPSNNSSSDRLLNGSPPTRLRSQSPSNHSSNGRIKGSPLRLGNASPSHRMQSPSCFPNGTDSAITQPMLHNAPYPQVEAGGIVDPSADVIVRLARGHAGFGFRIVGGTEDGSRVAVGYVVPGGPAEGLLRPGDLLTSVDGVPLTEASHARAVAHVCQAAARGHVTLGVRHNRADITPMSVSPAAPPHHQPAMPPEPPPHHSMPSPYNIVHPSPLYPPPVNSPHYGVQYGDPPMSNWAVPYDVTVTRNEGEGFGFVVISSTNKATTTIGQIIANSPASRCGMLRVGDTIVAINRVAVRSLPHPDLVALIKRSGAQVTLTVAPDGLA